MNQMQTAMVNAGLVKAPTTREVVWRVVKESMPNGITYRSLEKRLTTMPRGTIQSCLHAMVERGMLYTRGTRGYGPRGTCLEYLTDMDSYKLLPLPKLPPAKKLVALVKASEQPAPAPAKSVEIPSGLYMDNYTAIVAAFGRAGGDPTVLRAMTLAEFLDTAARNGMKLGVTL